MPGQDSVPLNKTLETSMLGWFCSPGPAVSGSACKKCKEYGHTVRSCPLNLSSCLENEQSDIDSCYYKY